MSEPRSKRTTALTIGAVVFVVGFLIVLLLPSRWEWLGRTAVTTGAVLAVVPFLADGPRRK